MPTFKSKQDVNCAFCDWRGRRDKLGNHFVNKHPNEKPRTKDQASISVFLKTKTRDGDEISSSEPLNKKIKLDESQSLCTESDLSCGQNNADVGDNVSISNRPTIYPYVFEQLSTINQAISGLNKKVDELLKPHQVKTIEIGPSS